MRMSRSALPALHTLAALPPRDADMLLRSAERLCLPQSGSEARFALRRITVYRRILGLPPSMNLMQMTWAASA